MERSRQAHQKAPSDAGGRPGTRPLPATGDGSRFTALTAVAAAAPPDTVDLLDLQRAAGNRATAQLFPAPAPVVAVQRANPADPRLPADQAEALVRAKDAKADIDAAL